METGRAWAEIDLEAFRHNVSVVRSVLERGVGLLAVVKADAYGHGAVAIAREAFACGVEMLGVGDVGEAAELREAGIGGPLLLLGAVLPGEEAAAIAHDVRITLNSADDLKRVRDAARAAGKRPKVHVKVDTGMHRLGAAPAEAIALAKVAVEAPEVEFEGLSTHLTSVRVADDDFSRAQLAAFRGVLAGLGAEGITPDIVHAANSTGLFRHAASHFTMVRAGIALYGAAPGTFSSLGISFKPVLALRTRVASIKGIGVGESVGYDRRFRAGRPSRIAVLPIGYYDGLPHRLTNAGTVLIRGRRAPIVGSVTMDYTMADVTEIADAAAGDVTTIVGRDGAEELTLEHLACVVGTIPYEIPCRLGRRVARTYLKPSEKMIDRLGKLLSGRAAAL